MAYRLDLTADDAGVAIRDCGRRQIRGALRKVERFDQEPVTATHEARKHIKKTRSLLLLARPALGGKAFKRENSALREAARPLASVRDTHVAATLVEQLAGEIKPSLSAAELRTLKSRLELGEAEEPAPLDQTAVLSATERLQEALERVQQWPLDRCEWRDVFGGAKLIYRKSRRRLAALGSEPSAAELHEWRKQVKHHWYATRLLSDLWPAVMKAQAGEAHRLTELLGDDHDLDLLAARLRTKKTRSDADARRRERLRSVIEARRAALLAEALPLGRLLYAEKPGAYRRRLSGWVH